MTMRQKQTQSELRSIAECNGLGLKFTYDAGLWTASDSRGRVLWCGKLADMRRIAMGKPVKP